jgi:malate dehydrogenase (oxaloacetate-decarboxylating)
MKARKLIFMINSRGLVIGSMSGLKDFQLRLCQSDARLREWGISSDTATLAETVKHSASTVIVGVSTVAGLFTQEIIEQMQANTGKPIVLPLSNPTSKVEAVPEDILKWTKGNAIVATGSPFDPVELNGKTYVISQCNNSYIFPGVGLGVVASKASRVTDNMLMASSYALAEYAAVHDSGSEELLPDLNDIRNVSKYIAKMVYKQAIKDEVTPEVSDEHIDAAIARNFWRPAYRNYKRNTF